MSLVAVAFLATAFPKNSGPLIGHIFPGVTTIEECQKLFDSKAGKWIVHSTNFVVSIDGRHSVKGKRAQLLDSMKIELVSSNVLLNLIGAKTPEVTMSALEAGEIDLRWLGCNRRTISSALSQRRMRPRITPNAFTVSVPIKGNLEYRRYQIELLFTKASMTSIRINLAN